MAQHSVADAARLVGRDRRTLYKDIQRGRLTATVSATGERQIDTAELIRAYGEFAVAKATTATVARAQEATVSATGRRQGANPDLATVHGECVVAEATMATVARAQEATGVATTQDAEIAQLRAQVAALEARLADKQQHIEHLAQAMRLLEHRPTPEPPPARRSWWPFGHK